MIFAIENDADPGHYLMSDKPERMPGTWAIIRDGPTSYNDLRTIMLRQHGTDAYHCISPEHLHRYVIYHPAPKPGLLLVAAIVFLVLVIALTIMWGR